MASRKFLTLYPETHVAPVADRRDSSCDSLVCGQLRTPTVKS